jgi:transcriptional regulator with GAF, ATPase, and Fis domain
MEYFINYQWPGNVRELKNVVQRILFSGEDIITKPIAKRSVGLIEMLRDESNDTAIKFPSSDDIIPLKTMEKLFREKYFKFVRQNSESDTDAANKLGLAPPNFHRMCKELGLK